MKLRTTLALLVVAAALGVFIFALDRCSQSTRDRQERATHLGRANRKDIRGITIQNGEETIRLKADGDDWKMIAPWNDDADIGVARARKRWRRSGSPVITSRLASSAAAIAGGGAVEKMNVRAR